MLAYQDRIVEKTRLYHSIFLGLTSRRRPDAASDAFDDSPVRRLLVDRNQSGRNYRVCDRCAVFLSHPKDMCCTFSTQAGVSGLGLDY